MNGPPVHGGSPPAATGGVIGQLTRPGHHEGVPAFLGTQTRTGPEWRGFCFKGKIFVENLRFRKRKGPHWNVKAHTRT